MEQVSNEKTTNKTTSNCQCTKKIMALAKEVEQLKVELENCKKQLDIIMKVLKNKGV